MPEAPIKITDVSKKEREPRSKEYKLTMGIGYIGGKAEGGYPVSPTYIQGANRQNTSDAPEAYDTKHDYASMDEKELFDLYEFLSFHNEFGAFLLDTYVSQLFPQFHFESSKPKSANLKKVQRFWSDHNMNKMVREVIVQAGAYGTGVASYSILKEDNQLLDFRRVDTKSLDIKKDESGRITVEQTGTETRQLDSYMYGRIPQNLFLYQPYPNPLSAWGYSPFRPLIHAISGMSDMSKDIFAAIKNFGYTQRVVSLDLKDAANKEEKDKAILEATKFFDRFESATNSVLIHENVHQYGFAGTIAGQTSTGQRLVPLMPIIQPILAVALNRFKMSMGLLSPDDAKVLKEQEQMMEASVQPFREALKQQILNEIIPRILAMDYKFDETDWRMVPEHDILIVWDIGQPSSIRDKIDIYTVAVEYGLVTPRFASEQCGFKDPYASWDDNGFLEKSETEEAQAEAQTKAATMRPTMGKGSSVTSKVDARRGLRRGGGPGPGPSKS